MMIGSIGVDLFRRTMIGMDNGKVIETIAVAVRWNVGIEVLMSLGWIDRKATVHQRS
jgi:hypothetical protein